jgi:hypothetical protein
MDDLAANAVEDLQMTAATGAWPSGETLDQPGKSAQRANLSPNKRPSASDGGEQWKTAKSKGAGRL